MLMLVGCTGGAESPAAATAVPAPAQESSAARPQLIEFYAGW